MATLLGLCACDAAKELRAELRGEARGPSLRLEVQPAEGLSIELDGAKVADRSPFETALGPGDHALLIQAPGYYPFHLPVELGRAQRVVLPIALRPIPPLPPPKAADVDPAAPPPPEPPAPALPAGVSPVTLIVAPTPAVLLGLDERPIDGRSVTFERVHGELTIGQMRLGYRLGGSGVLDLTVPDDGARWLRDGTPVLPGNAFRLNPGTVRLTRTSADGIEQAAVLRRP